MAQSFRDINGNDIAFESKYDLKLDLQRDVVTKQVTAYVVYYNDNTFYVNEETYKALDNL